MRRYKKHISIFLLIIFLNEIVFTNVAYALGGGPSQPEVQSFEPIGTTQMVDLFSGDFNYNIPLMDIDGYPINIAYHSGITMDQEASWVGLGWNLNPGVINRNMRGIPDDFNGDEIKRTTYLEPDETWGGQIGASGELFGMLKQGKNNKISKDNSYKTAGQKDTAIMNNSNRFKNVALNLSANFGVNYNNYKGIGSEFSIGAQFSAGAKLTNKDSKRLGLGVSGSLGIMLSNSSQGGGTVTPSYGLDVNLLRKSKDWNSGGLGGISISSSTSFNSNAATKQFTKISANANFDYNRSKKYKSNDESDRKRRTSIGIGTSFNSFVNHSYTPQIQHSMSNYNITMSFKTGLEIKGISIDGQLKGYYAGQLLNSRGSEIKLPSYGYHYAENSTGMHDVLMDFNREKDGSFSIHNPTLPIPQNTQDMYAFSGQGVGGMFKSYRSDLGAVYDPKKNSSGKSDSYGLATNFGDIFKLSGDVYLNWTESESKQWYNKAIDIFKYAKQEDMPSNPLFEPSYFKVIGEKSIIDNNFLPYMELNNPSAFILKTNGDDVGLEEFKVQSSFANGNTNELPIKNSKRGQRDKRNVFVKQLKASESEYCLENQMKNIGSTSIARSGSFRKPYHFSEISVQNPDGNRYVYGIAAYATNQQEFTFTNAPNPGGGSSPSKDCSKGLVTYDVQKFGQKDRVCGGIDKYFDKNELPAYAHSYLLTAVLSPDYVDNGNNGPSDDDYGNFTRIDYTRYHDAYKWRVPYEQDKASYNRGYYNDNYDDNASIIYGEKEIWHVSSIEGRNHIAKFYVSARKDGYGTLGIHGGLNNQLVSYKLDSIKLFSKSNLDGPPIKSVYFVYNYKLCPGIDNNIDKNVSGAQNGKLTLEKIYFTYGNSSKGKYNVYNFGYNYTSTNYSYNLKGYDRWGNFKHNENATCNDFTKPLTSEFPYVEQNKDSADKYTQAWNLTEIGLPTGGKITVSYESDDYAYVQDKKAMQMYQVLGLGSSISDNPSNKLYVKNNSFQNTYTTNDLIFVQLQDQSLSDDYFKKMALANQTDLYYNAMVNLDNKELDYANYRNILDVNSSYEPIKGYAKPIDAGVVIKNGIKVGWVKIEKVKVSDEVDDLTNPIAKSSWQFTRLNMPYLINPGANLMKKGNGFAQSAISIVKTIVGFIPDVISSFQDANKKLRNAAYASEINVNKTWIRLNNLNGFKYGGGCRVKKLVLSDEWNIMEPTGNASSKTYGQVFEYTKIEKENGVDKIISSGVASYEPLLGNEENPFKKPVYYSEEQKGIPDEEYFSEEPFGETYFPAAGVGYSRVTVKSISPDQNNVAANKTGKVVHEFYTAQDFPTKTSRTDIQVQQVRPNWIWDIFKSQVDDRLTASQGYMVELNDMHGKPKAVWNFSADKINEYNSSEAFSGVSYEYFADNVTKSLNNKVPVISPNNVVYDAIVGVDAELFADTRESTFRSESGGVQVNLDVFSIGIFPIPIPTGLPDLSNESTLFRSAVLMKVVNKYGILKSTTVFENSAELHTENILFDSETGDVLLTKTENEFNDYTYNSTYPAHWVYENMGPAYKNTGAIFTINAENATYDNFKLKVNGSTEDPSNYLVTGDEVELKYSTGSSHQWVYKTPDNKYVLLDLNGNIYNFPNTTNSYTIRVITSGRKNMQSLPVSQVVSIENPIVNNHLVHNTNTKILQTSVNEYKDNWPMYGCFETKCNSLNIYDETIEIMKYLLSTNQILMKDNKKTVLCSPMPCPFGAGNDQYSSLIELANSDSTYFKSIYRKYADSCGLATNGFYRSVVFGSGTSPEKKLINISYNLIGGTFNNKLVEYDNIRLNYGVTLLFEEDSNLVNEILQKEITSLTFEGTFDVNNSNFGFLNFTDDSKIEVQILPLGSEIRLCDYTIYKSDNVNPFRKNLVNNWKPYKNKVYLESRLTENNSVNTNIRKDGSFKNYTHYWNYGSNKWQANPSSNWQFTKEITKYHLTGNEAESKNPLEQYSSVVYSGITHMPIAVGQNIKHRNIIAENFEEGPYEDYYPICGSNNYKYRARFISPQYFYRDNGFNNDSVSHTGVSSYKGNQSFQVQYLPNDKTIDNGTNKFNLDTTNIFGTFSPDPGKYIISAWVKVGKDPKVSDYSNASIKLSFKTLTSNSELNIKPKGKIIEGWQRISEEFTIPNGIVRMNIGFENAGDSATYFDDFRVYPIDGLMKSYVYDKNHRLVAELDENNYATFYEYDEEGNLARIKKETERGIMTIKEVRSSFKKNN